MTINPVLRRDITRAYKVESGTIASGAATSEEIDFGDYAGGIVVVPAAWTAANIGFQVSPTTGGTFAILRDYLGSPVQISGIKTDGSRAYQMPDEVFACGFVKLWSKSTTAATETDTNQGGARALTILLKG